MSDVTAVRGDFPQTKSAQLSGVAQRSRERSLNTARRLTRAIPDVDDLVCEKFFCDHKRSITRFTLHKPCGIGRKRGAARITYSRHLAWYILRNHPDIRASYPQIGRAYNRDHSCIHYGVEKLRQLILDNRGDHILKDLQNLCDRLARKGYSPFHVWHNL